MSFSAYFVAPAGDCIAQAEIGIIGGSGLYSMKG